ncbi:hypothetical protein [Formosa algae]|uniref:hypothetical protein n=1 Tax=Formosa algae TaxID=225843 RepID=UPI000CCDB1B4|nr:hypothetical protein [Formosa algae]PNW28667.1 hypothetical protein BKP44_06995 [Formosa algae]
MRNLLLTSVFMGIIFSSISFYAASPIKVTMQDGVFVLQDDFKEIETATLPSAVKESVSKYFPEAQISKAYVNEAKEYKLNLVKEGLSTTVYANAMGQWISK